MKGTRSKGLGRGRRGSGLSPRHGASELAVDAAAVYRLVRLAQQDTILDGVREQLIVKYGERRWVELITCAWCLSIWVAGGVVIARAVSPRLWGMIARALAFSAAAGVITGLVDQLEHGRP